MTATEALGESAAIARALGDGWSLAHSLMNQALMAFRHGALDLAVERYRESLTALRGDSDRWFVSRSLQGLASVVWATRQPSCSRPIRFSAGTSTPSRNTSLNSLSPVI